MSGFDYEKDADGIVTVTMDMVGSVNAMNAAYRQLMAETIDRLEQEPGLAGVIFASAKRTFFAGGDLNELLALQPGDEAAFHATIETTKNSLRRLEHLPVPVVAAINGAALGGGFELALAANHRILLDHPSAVVGLPEVNLGLLPGAGGVVRTVHLLGFEKALPLLLEGRRMSPAEALAACVIDQLHDDEGSLIEAARAWIKANPQACQQPWDRRSQTIPGGRLPASSVAQAVLTATVALGKKTRGLLPAPEHILTVAAEATIVDFDTALRIETRSIVTLAFTAQAKNLITSNFFQINEINGGASRPGNIAKRSVSKLGILGAGMMGQGVAYMSAMAGINVVLRDLSLESAQNGKAYTQKLLQAAVDKGRMDTSKRDAVLALITPTADVSDLDGCDLIVEAVYESVELKAAVTREAEPQLVDGGVFATNTSTLPITLLAKAAQRPENFIGIHFFSPVERMPLVEIICGELTSDATLALAFDYARQIGKTPIVVNDSLAFFTSRTFSTFLDEGTRLLQEGVAAASIENHARQIGMPVGPLAVLDEVSLELMRKVNNTQREMGVLHSKTDTCSSEAVCELMITEHGRGGRQYGGGFYDYPHSGEKSLWPGLIELFGSSTTMIDADDVKDRLLFRQVIETIRCLEEGVLRSVADGNIGSLLGIGAPTWTGGFLQFVNTYGVQRFAQRSAELAARYGERFAPPALLLEKVDAGASFR